MNTDICRETTSLKCVGLFNNQFIAALLRSVSVKECRKYRSMFDAVAIKTCRLTFSYHPIDLARVMTTAVRDATHRHVVIDVRFDRDLYNDFTECPTTFRDFLSL